MSAIDDAVGPRPQEVIPAAPARARTTLGPGYDWFMELLRQIGRPALFVVLVLAVADFFLFAGWYRGGEGRVSETAIGLALAAALGMCGIRAVELMRPPATR